MLRRPRRGLAVAAARLIVLGAIGTGVEGRLDPTTPRRLVASQASDPGAAKAQRLSL